jgi:hypothetical protein
MKKFITTLLIFLLPILLVGSLIELCIRNIPNDYTLKRNYLDRYSDSVEVLILGNSHDLYGINPELMEAKTFNAANVSQTYNLDYKILMKYQYHWKQLKCIVISVDYFSFYMSLEASDEKWRIKNYEIYYGIDVVKDLRYNSEILSSNFKINLKRLYKTYIEDVPVSYCTTLGWAANYNTSSNTVDLNTSGMSRAKYHTAISDANFFNENITMLSSIIEFAKRNNIKVLLFTSPCYKAYVANLKKEQLSRTIAEIEKLKCNFSNVSYINLLSDTSFLENDFFDANHVNHNGARKLTNKIDRQLTLIK